ncbi:MAG: hypothetical protein LBL83_12375 [Clostridiales bacterium]|jgi:hypothetical protein|nr:hypothetical protein [Clostridiales bacterium]
MALSFDAILNMVKAAGAVATAASAAATAQKAPATGTGTVSGAGALSNNQQLGAVPVASSPQAAYTTAVPKAANTPAPTTTTSYGVSYNPNVDYKALMDAAAAAGQYQVAAQYEQMRNAKLSDMGLGNQVTSLYYDSAGIGGTRTQATNVDLNSAQYGGTNPYYPAVSGADAARWQGLATQPAAQQAQAGQAQSGQAGQTLEQQALASYLAQNGGSGSGSVNGLISQINNYPSFDYPAQPTWYDQYGSVYNKALAEVLYRQPFSYSKETDPSYAAYAKQYLMEGDRATENAIARAAALSGGIPSSAAVKAGTQAGDYYAAQLSGKIPELYQQAYDRYVSEFSMDREALSDVSGARTFDYGTYRDNVGDYQNNRQFSYSDYLNQYDMRQNSLNNYINADNTAYSRAYTASRDSVADSRYDTEWAYTVAQQQQAAEASAAAQAAKEKQALFDNALTLFDAGLTSEQIAAAIGNGVTKAQMDAIIAEAKAAKAKASSGGGGGGDVVPTGAGGGSDYSISPLELAYNSIVAAMDKIYASTYNFTGAEREKEAYKAGKYALENAKGLTDDEFDALAGEFGISF